MIGFLTSSPMTRGTGEIDPSNGFLEELTRALPKRRRMLFVCSDPESFDATDRFASELLRALEGAGLGFGSMAVLDGRNEFLAPELVRKADLIVLAGGHVPTQNAFFRRIGLRELLRSRDGAVLGISAGTMNSAKEVYAQPELPGEAVDPDFVRFLPGLGLTRVRVVPHYNGSTSIVGVKQN